MKDIITTLITLVMIAMVLAFFPWGLELFPYWKSVFGITGALAFVMVIKNIVKS